MMATLNRRPDWQSRLVDYLGRASRMPFQPGRHDCALFAAGAVEAMTGVDLAAHWRGRYRTLRGGVRVLRRDGYADHVALAAAHFRARGAGEVAMPGDLAAVPTQDGPALGVVQGQHVYVVGPDGLGMVPVVSALVVFEVA
jgi:hypothetical protein